MPRPPQSLHSSLHSATLHLQREGDSWRPSSIQPSSPVSRRTPPSTLVSEKIIRRARLWLDKPVDVTASEKVTWGEVEMERRRRGDGKEEALRGVIGRGKSGVESIVGYLLERSLSLFILAQFPPYFPSLYFLFAPSPPISPPHPPMSLSLALWLNVPNYVSTPVHILLVCGWTKIPLPCLCPPSPFLSSLTLSGTSLCSSMLRERERDE